MLKKGDRFTDFIIEAEIGQGGMGTVYLVQPVPGTTYPTEEPLVLKIIHTRDLKSRQACIDEAFRLLKLNQIKAHPNLVGVYDLIQSPNLAIVMEYIPGQTLSDVRHYNVQQIVSWIHALADVLDFVHASSIVHLDLKPENIIVHPKRGPVLLDFGISKQVRSSGNKFSRVVGTPIYMSPEQIRQVECTPKADQYAMAVLAYEYLSGYFPWADGLSTLKLMEIKSKGDLYSFHTVTDKYPRLVSDVIMTALSLNPEDRFNCCSTFASALAAALSDCDSATVLTSRPLDSSEDFSSGTEIVPPVIANISRTEVMVSSTKDTVSVSQISLDTSVEVESTSQESNIFLKILVVLLLIVVWMFYDVHSEQDLVTEQYTAHKADFDEYDLFQEPQTILEIKQMKSTLQKRKEMMRTWTELKDDMNSFQMDVPKNIWDASRLQTVQDNIDFLKQFSSELPQHFTEVRIPAGMFKMGCTNSQYECSKSSRPLHYVNIEHDFLMMNKEVTQEFYRLVCERLSQYRSKPVPSKGNDNYGAENPVSGLSWKEAVVFANVLSVIQKLTPCYQKKEVRVGSKIVKTYDWNDKKCNGWRLPTEAEWEYASKYENQFIYAGSDTIDDVAWYEGNSNRRTHIGCSKRTMSSGLCDMTGNVSEWVWDISTDYDPSRKTNPVSDEIGADWAFTRRVRGGSYMDMPSTSPVYKRESTLEEGMEKWVGFRLVRTVPGVKK